MKIKIKRQNRLWNCMEAQWEQLIEELKQEENVNGVI
jgi:hypothetical protein